MLFFLAIVSITPSVWISGGWMEQTTPSLAPWLCGEKALIPLECLEADWALPLQGGGLGLVKDERKRRNRRQLCWQLFDNLGMLTP